MKSMRKIDRKSVRALVNAVITATLAVQAAATAAAEIDTVDWIPEIVSREAELPEPWDTGWSVRIDNDAFSGTSVDRDYSGGAILTFGGRRAATAPISLDPALQWLDRASSFKKRYERRGSSYQGHAMQLGVLLFTPEDIAAHYPIEDDRPYANLAYLANSQFSVSDDGLQMYQSTLTLGLLGTGIGESLQKVIHAASGSTEPRGFKNQVSNGGELTGRYAIARHSLLASGFSRDARYDLKLTLEGSIGFLTEGSAGLALRRGRIQTPWWASTADYYDYAAQPTPQASRIRHFDGKGESYFSAGVKVHARAYNAFLQGQVRSSAVTYSLGELRRLLFDAWIGYTADIRNVNVQYTLHHQSAEIKHGTGARDLTWAGITVAKSFR